MAGPNDLGPAVIALAWILSTASTLIVGLRIWVRLRVRVERRLSIDDMIVILTYGLGIVNSVFVTISAHNGLGKHIEVLADNPVAISQSIKWVFLSEGPAILASGFSRISFAILLLNITPPSKPKRRFLWSIIVIQFLADLAAVIVTYAQCKPLEAYWDKGVEGECWAPTVQQSTGFTQGSICSAVDIVLALYPASLFWKLNMKWQQKVYLSGIMGLGLIASVASIAKTIGLRAFTATNDFTYALGEAALWWTAEVNLVLVAVSIPTLSPIIKPRKAGASSGRSDGSGGVAMNTFHSWKQKQGKGAVDSEGDFERLKDDNYAYNSGDECPPGPKTYDYKISPQHKRDRNNSCGIRRDVTVSVTRGKPDDGQVSA